jgi:hypothetical protein
MAAAATASETAYGPSGARGEAIEERRSGALRATRNSTCKQNKMYNL